MEHMTYIPCAWHPEFFPGEHEINEVKYDVALIELPMLGFRELKITSKDFAFSLPEILGYERARQILMEKIYMYGRK